MSRSLRVAQKHIPQVKLAVKRKGFLNQSAFAREMGMARATISNFLNGKPIDHDNFVEICERLGLNCQAIAYIEDSDTHRETEQPSYPLTSLSQPEAVSTSMRSDGTMAQTEEEFIEAARNWDLERLYADLEAAKREWGVNKRWGLTKVEKQYLQGLLCGYSPDEIAEKLEKDVRLVRVQLSNNLYRYVEKLLDRPPNSLENWRDIVIWLAEAGYRLDTQLEQKEQNASVDIDALVQKVREKVKPFIQEQCGTMRVLDMTVPIGLHDIYTEANVLEKITGRRRVGIDELLQGFDAKSETFDRFELSRTAERVSGLEAVQRYSKLLVMGKPGAGKTTFLKYLAIQCNEGKLQSDRVPIFIFLRDFADDEREPTLLNYIIQMLSTYNVIADEIEQLLKEGRILVLLDGLDEVRQEHNGHVLKQIRNFSNRYHRNQFVMTCRIAAQAYTFEKFLEVEIADFDEGQIATFSKNWFKRKHPAKAKKFMWKLEEEARIKELATNPLLLTLLCLVFEQVGKFPKNRYDLYKEAIDILLIKWDVSRDIEREEIYKSLSLGDKRDLLSYIAYKTFEQERYFFKQRELEHYISDYLSNFPDAKTNPEELQLDSEAVLKSIEAQHGLLVERAKGIYSFSHLTFQEYFTARRIATSSDPYRLEKALQILVNHITEKRWREVFLLAVVLLRPADYLLNLMKQQVDSVIATDENLQYFLKWVNEQSIRVQESLLGAVTYKPAAIRAFYLDCDINIDIYRTLGCLIDLNCTYVLECASFLSRTLSLDLVDSLNIILKLAPDFTQFNALEFPMNIVFTRALAIDQALYIAPDLDPELKQVLQELKEQLPDPEADEEILIDWRKEKGQTWAERVKIQIVKPYKFGEHWQFNDFQKELLKQYYEANSLLMVCLNNGYVSREVRLEIEETLLLPIAEIERRKNYY